MRAVAVVVVAALLASVIAQDQCTGLNVTWTPGVQPLTLTKNTQTQACPYGTYKDTTQGGRCITYRQGINNFMGADCYTDNDCTGSGSLPLGCGSDKKCTWKNTRALGDSCTDNINCWSYVNNPAVNTSSIPTYCHATDKKCVTQVHVLVPAGQRCNYTANHQIFMCDAASTCRYYTTPANPQSEWGAGICVPLLTTNQVCGGNIKIPDYQYNDLWCGSGNVCYGQFPNNRTCQAARKQGETCYVYGQELECDQSTARLYCNGVSKTCVPYVGANTNCTGAYGSSSTSGDMCQNGLRCLLNNVLGYRQCAAANSVGQVCTQTTDINAGNNCTTGLQCIFQPLRGHYTSQCSAGANGDVCQIFGGTPPALIDSCQPGLFCQQYAPANYTCIPKFTAGTFCNSSSQCQDGIACLNSTCTVYQTVGQPCNDLLTNPLNRLQCNPSLQCSRGMCINNYTVPIGGWCSQDRDCENAHCDVFYKKCTRRKLCSSSTTCGGSRPCACSAGAENMGQCMMDTCGKASNALRDCLTPLEYNPFSNSSFFPNSFSNPAAEAYVFQDTQSSFYSKCAQQHNDYISCRALMAKWGAPAVALGDFAPAYNLQVAGASSVTVSVVVMITFVMTVIMNL